MIKEKAEIAKSVGKNQDKQADSFYNFVHADSKIEETPTHYFVSSRVPEHEKENVKMHVSDGKVVVQGARRFEDKIDTGEGKLATNSYQTFREELPLERPVHEKLVERTYENGVLTLKIPKA